MKLEDVWSLFNETYHAISAYYVPKMNQKAAAMNLPEGGWWLLLPVLSFDPEPTSVEKLRIRVPYASAQWFKNGLRSLAERGFLAYADDSQDDYLLTTSGNASIKAVVHAAYDVMAQLEPLPTSELEKIAGSLLSLVNASMKAPMPPGKWSITYSRRLDPGRNAPVMVRIDQYLSDLAAYRDDAHLASWQSHQVEAQMWETLTVIWQEESITLDDLYQKLTRRGFEKQEYAKALEDLVDRGWVDVTAGIYSLTWSGKDIRQAAEEKTDHYFYAPWTCLRLKEKQNLIQQMTRLKEVLQEV